MRYALIDIDTAEKAGFLSVLHTTDAGKMILNENELSKLGDPSEVAEQLGGKLMSRTETFIEIYKNR